MALWEGINSKNRYRWHWHKYFLAHFFFVQLNYWSLDENEKIKIITLLFQFTLDSHEYPLKLRKLLQVIVSTVSTGRWSAKATCTTPASPSWTWTRRRWWPWWPAWSRTTWSPRLRPVTVLLNTGMYSLDTDIISVLLKLVGNEIEYRFAKYFILQTFFSGKRSLLPLKNYPYCTEKFYQKYLKEMIFFLKDETVGSWQTLFYQLLY